MYTFAVDESVTIKMNIFINTEKSDLQNLIKTEEEKNFFQFPSRKIVTQYQNVKHAMRMGSDFPNTLIFIGFCENTFFVSIPKKSQVKSIKIVTLL